MDTAVPISNIIHDLQAMCSDEKKKETVYFHVLCTFELLLQDQDGVSPLLKAVSAINWAGFFFSFCAINYFLCGMCLFGWWGVSTAMHTLSGLLTGSENYLASLEIFETAGCDNRKLCPRNNVYMRGFEVETKA